MKHMRKKNKVVLEETEKIKSEKEKLLQENELLKSEIKEFFLGKREYNKRDRTFKKKI